MPVTESTAQGQARGASHGQSLETKPLQARAKKEMSRSPMVIEIVRTEPELAALAPDWHRLWDRCGKGQVFQHPAWAKAFVESFCTNTRWLVLAMRRDNELVSLLPVWESPKQGAWRLLGSPNADYQYLLGEPANLAQLMAELPKHGVKMLHMEEMPEGPALWQALRSFGLAIEPDGEPSPCRRMRLTTESVAALRRKGGMKDNERRLSKLGALRMKVYATPEERIAALEILFAQHRQRWDATSTPSQFNDERSREFYRRLCRDEDMAAFLHFSALEAGEINLACHFGFVANDTVLYYKPTYDVGYKGAGKLLMARIMEDGVRLGVKEFDFTRGDEGYKVELATTLQNNYDARLFFSTPAHLCFKAREWLRRMVPRDENGLALTTKMVRRTKSLIGGR